MRFVSSPTIPPRQRHLFTANVRYKVVEEKWKNDHTGTSLAFVIDDNGNKEGPIRLNGTCAYLDGAWWDIHNS